MACGNKDKLRNMGHGLANFIVRQHKNQKIESKRNKKKDAESKSTTKDIYQGERADDSKKNVETKVNGAKKDEWEGDEWVDSDSDVSLTILKFLSFLTRVIRLLAEILTQFHKFFSKSTIV